MDAHPSGKEATRLVTRVQAFYDWHQPAAAVHGMVLMEFGDFAMMRRMLLGIRHRVQTLERFDDSSDG